MFFTSDLTSSERRISPQWTLAFLKRKIEQITGVPPKFQVLQYHPRNTSNDYVVLTAEDDENVTVADLNIKPFCRIHVQDTNPDTLLADLAQYEQADGFRLSKEAYEKRSDSVLQWKKQQQLGRFNPSYENRIQQLDSENAAFAKCITVGDRCRIINLGGERRGTVKYIGKIQSLDEGKTFWVGIEFDEPVGKNDGSLDGVRYFNAKNGYGSFVAPKKVEIGDFPEEHFMNSDDEEI